MMVGQEQLRSRLLNCQNASQLPNSILLLGDSGCGKHTLAKEMSDNYGLPLIDITKSISYESIEQIYLNPTQAFYLVDIDGVTERQQNALLKFVEEPLANSHLILLSSSKNKVLNTIINRCVSYDFKPYTKEELRGFIKDEDEGLILGLCTTPGQIIGLRGASLKGLNDLCDNMVANLGKAKYPNALSIAKKINYKDEYDKFDFEVFLRCYKQHLWHDYVDNGSKLSYDLYNIVVSLEKVAFIPNINKEYFMETLITKLWERSKNEVK